MADQSWTPAQLGGFRDAAQSLKLYRRAELEDEVNHRSLIKDLYVDPLPREHVFQTILKPNTTFLIGRKGTGKSTIFQRLQFELRHKPGYASAYVDIKTAFEESSATPALAGQLGPDTFGEEDLRRLRLYRAFIKAVINEIKNQIRKKLTESSWALRLRSVVTDSSDTLFQSLDGLLRTADATDFQSVTAIRREVLQGDAEEMHRSETSGTFTATAGPKPELKAALGGKDSSEFKLAQKVQYGDVLMAVFNIKEVLLQLKDILDKAGIKHLYVLVDDFSELPEDAMTVVVDTLLAPLNNWSEELVKFKIAAYPHRVYYGKIDKTKIDEIYLDTYRLYGTTDVSAMEDKATDFTRRLVSNRLAHFAGCGIEPFIEDGSMLWPQLFDASMGNPRILGHLLYYAYESHLIYGSKIGSKAIRDAAARYYSEKLESYFKLNKFLHESFNEHASVFSLKALLEAIVERARKLKRDHKSEVMRNLRNPPTSHFHVATGLTSLLDSLELNFFITKYYEMNDRDGRKVAVYALNYGLCQRYSVTFGRPKERREHRVYLVERVFDYTSLLREFMQHNQEIRCRSCDTTYELDKLEALTMFGMQCPECRNGTCSVTNLSRKYESLLNDVAPALLLPATELGILHTLETEKTSMYAGDIAAEMDRSYQLIGKRAKILAERGLVNRDLFEQGRRVFAITPLAEASYFSQLAEDALRLELEPEDGVH